MTKEYEVIIVGGGPVGIGLALELGLRGISCLLVERRIGLSNIPKGQNLTQRTMEHFHFWGIADAVRAARIMPKSSPIGEFVSYRHLDSPYWYTGQGRSVVNDYYFQANERLPQYLTEEVMRARLEELVSVEARFGWTFLEVSESGSNVQACISKSDGAQREVVSAQYLVGCDGGHSLVREQAGIGRVGPEFDQTMVLAVFRSRDLHNELSRRYPERSTYRVMHPDLRGFWQFFGRVDVGEQWFFHAPVPPDATKENWDFHSMLERIAGFPFACTFDHVGFWDLRVALAEKYRVGRIFIAGDAAHNHPPYGGFGLNNGLEDIRNLGWKLFAALKGWSGAHLLDSYDEERRPVFREIAEEFIAARIRADGDFLAKYDPDRNKAEFETQWNHRKSEYSDRAHTYEPHYEGSSTIFGPPGGKCGASGSHTFKARPGHHLPPQPLSGGQNVYELLGDGFTLLAFDQTSEVLRHFAHAAEMLSIPLKVVTSSFSGGPERYGSKIVLVRPDQFVAWAANSAPTDPSAVLRKVVGYV